MHNTHEMLSQAIAITYDNHGSYILVYSFYRGCYLLKLLVVHIKAIIFLQEIVI